MPSLTDGEIRRALKQVEQTGKAARPGRWQKDMAPVALVLVIKPMPRALPPIGWRSSGAIRKRFKKKLGSYPSMSLSKAREVFTRDFADMIQKGRSIKIAGDTRPGTVADLFEAYVAHLKAIRKVVFERG